MKLVLLKNEVETAEQLIEEYGIEGQIEVVLNEEDDNWFSRAMSTLTEKDVQ
jgi:hypothetical protein